MLDAVTTGSGFAEVGAGSWLAGRGQPAAFLGEAVRRRRKGWLLRDRSSLDLVETTGRAWCADADRPFLTHIPCAAPINAVSSKILVAPACAWTAADVLKPVPMSFARAIATSRLEREWVIMATASRTVRIAVEDGDTLAVRPESAVAWTGNRPTGFVRRLGIWDVLLPRTPRDLILHFHGPCIVWVEGQRAAGSGERGTGICRRRCHGV